MKGELRCTDMVLPEHQGVERLPTLPSCGSVAWLESHINIIAVCQRFNSYQFPQTWEVIALEQLTSHIEQAHHITTKTRESPTITPPGMR